MLATIVVQPFAKKKLKPENIIRFPWDKKSKTPNDVLTTEERKTNLQDAIKRLGDNYY